MRTVAKTIRTAGRAGPADQSIATIIPASSAAPIQPALNTTSTHWLCAECCADRGISPVSVVERLPLFWTVAEQRRLLAVLGSHGPQCGPVVQRLRGRSPVVLHDVDGGEQRCGQDQPRERGASRGRAIGIEPRAHHEQSGQQDDHGQDRPPASSRHGHAGHVADQPPTGPAAETEIDERKRGHERCGEQVLVGKHSREGRAQHAVISTRDRRDVEPHRGQEAARGGERDAEEPGTHARAAPARQHRRGHQASEQRDTAERQQRTAVQPGRQPCDRPQNDGDETRRMDRHATRLRDQSPDQQHHREGEHEGKGEVGRRLVPGGKHRDELAGGIQPADQSS